MTKSIVDTSLPVEKVEIFKDLKVGLNKILDSSHLKSLYSFPIITGLSVGVIIPLFLPFTIEVLKQSESQFGLIIGSFGLGGLLGGLISSRVGKLFSPGETIAYFSLIESILLLVWIHISYFPLSIFILIIWGMVVFIKIPAQYTYVALNFGPQFQTRLNSVLEIAFFLPNVLGNLIIMSLGNKFSTYQILGAMAVFCLLVNILRISTPSTRSFIKS